MEQLVAENAPDEAPIFQALASSTRQDLLANSVQHSVASGTVLFEQGDTPNFQLIVLAGSIQLFGRSSGGREVLIEVVRAPELVVPAAVVTGEPYLMQARVPEPSRLLMIHAAAFRTAASNDPALARAVIVGLAYQFRRMVRQIKNLKLRSGKERVGAYVLALSRHQGTPDRAVLPYEKHLIASELGITRESFSRALSALKSIHVEGGTIIIRDAKKLASECRPDPLIDAEELGTVGTL